MKYGSTATSPWISSDASGIKPTNRNVLSRYTFCNFFVSALFSFLHPKGRNWISRVSCCKSSKLVLFSVCVLWLWSSDPFNFKLCIMGKYYTHHLHDRLLEPKILPLHPLHFKNYWRRLFIFCKLSASSFCHNSNSLLFLGGKMPWTQNCFIFTLW